MTKFKVQDSAGKRFVVRASNISEARQIARGKTNAKTIYVSRA